MRPTERCIPELEQCLFPISSKFSGRRGEWLQVDLRQPTFVTGIITQGRAEDQWRDQLVRSYKITFANQTNAFQYVTDKMGQDMVRTIQHQW